MRRMAVAAQRTVCKDKFGGVAPNDSRQFADQLGLIPGSRSRIGRIYNIRKSEKHHVAYAQHRGRQRQFTTADTPELRAGCAIQLVPSALAISGADQRDFEPFLGTQADGPRSEDLVIRMGDDDQDITLFGQITLHKDWCPVAPSLPQRVEFQRQAGRGLRRESLNAAARIGSKCSLSFRHLTASTYRLSVRRASLSDAISGYTETPKCCGIT